MTLAILFIWKKNYDLKGKLYAKGTHNGGEGSKTQMKRQNIIEMFIKLKDKIFINFSRKSVTKSGYYCVENKAICNKKLERDSSDTMIHPDENGDMRICHKDNRIIDGKATEDVSEIKVNEVTSDCVASGNNELVRCIEEVQHSDNEDINNVLGQNETEEATLMEQESNEKELSCISEVLHEHEVIVNETQLSALDETQMKIIDVNVEEIVNNHKNGDELCESKSMKDNAIDNEIFESEECLEEIEKNALSRRERESLFEDNTELVQTEMNMKYASYLKEIPENDAFSKLRNRIVREFVEVKLLCEIEISDEEFELLCSYFRKKYIHIRRNVEKAVVDIIFSVALVQIGIRYYDGNYWKQVEKVLGIKNLPLAQRPWLGGTVTETLLAFGKPLVSPQEYVSNILMHGFVVDFFSVRFFDYLFQYYNLDLQRDITGLSDEDLDYICYSIKNPFGMRKQLLSKYMELSVRGNEEYCKKIISQALNYMDMSFWQEYSGEEQLTGRYLVEFEKWKDISTFYNHEKSKREEEVFSGHKEKIYRKPHLKCNLEMSEFEAILPSQMVRVLDEQHLPEVTWKITTEQGDIQIKCLLDEGYSGYKTREVKISLKPEQIFDEISFELFDGSNLLRKFMWRKRKINFFDECGHWIASENLDQGTKFAYSEKNTEVLSDCILAKSDKNGLAFWELELKSGDLIKVVGENNYYIGNVPNVGLTHEFICEDVLVVGDEGEKYNVFSNLPALIVDIPAAQFSGTAIIINGKISRLSEKDFIDVKCGRKDEEKYYFLSLDRFENLHQGINSVKVDFPGSSREVNEKFVYIKDFSYSFEDAPYIFQERGTLCIDRKIEKNIITMQIPRENDFYDFSIDELNNDYIQFPIQFDEGLADIRFTVPALFCSWNQQDWFSQKPDDIWHGDLHPVLYLKFPEKQISLGLGENSHKQISFLFNKNAQNIFVCDLTRLKSNFYDGHMIQIIKFICNQSEYDLFKVIMKSYLCNTILEADYERDCLSWKFDIIGKNTYFADVVCEDEVLAEKACILDGLLELKTPIKSAKYTVKVFESDGDFGFDDEYDYVGDSINSVINPAELTNSCMLVKGIRSLDKMASVKELNYDDYLFISGVDSSKEDERHCYIGTLVEVFYKDSVVRASNVCVFIPDLNKISEVSVTFLDDDGDDYEFLYDVYTKCIVENENPRFSKSEAYRRYEILYTDSYIWEVQYIEGNPRIEQLGIEWMCKYKAHSQGNEWKWKNEESTSKILIEDLNLSARSYNCLKRAGLLTLSQIALAYQKGNLLKVRNLGRKNYEEICMKLKERNLL